MKKTYLVTAGPTIEKIDPVRFISNFSTGKMGFAIAEALASAGARVLLVSGPVTIRTSNPSISRIDVLSADEMFEACSKVWPECDGAVLTAAVADYKPANPCQEKIKREAGDLLLELSPNRDIAAFLGENKRPGQLLVGFALETANEMEHARAKLLRKNLDMIVLNSLKDEGAGFGTDTNKVTIIRRNGALLEFPLKSKTEVAQDIVDCIADLS